MTEADINQVIIQLSIKLKTSVGKVSARCYQSLFVKISILVRELTKEERKEEYSGQKEQPVSYSEGVMRRAERRSVFWEREQGRAV